MAYLSILKLEDKFRFGTLDILADKLGSYPALGSIRLPCSGADIIG